MSQCFPFSAQEMLPKATFYVFFIFVVISILVNLSSQCKSRKPSKSSKSIDPKNGNLIEAVKINEAEDDGDYDEHDDGDDDEGNVNEGEKKTFENVDQLKCKYGVIWSFTFAYNIFYYYSLILIVVHFVSLIC